MLRRILALSVSAILCLSCLSGCKKDSNETEPDQEVVKTEAQHKAEAEKEIEVESEVTSSPRSKKIWSRT